MTRNDILTAAAQAVNGTRAQDYGTPESNCGRIAKLWEAYTGHSYTATDAAVMLALLKVARIGSGRVHPDNFVDLAGYAALAGEIATQEAQGAQEARSVCAGWADDPDDAEPAATDPDGLEYPADLEHMAAEAESLEGPAPFVLPLSLEMPGEFRGHVAEIVEAVAGAVAQALEAISHRATQDQATEAQEAGSHCGAGSCHTCGQCRHQ